MNTNLLFSVIIPTRHRNDLLAKCLDCLKPENQTMAFEQYEVIVTDDGTYSTAKTLIQEQYTWAKWTPGPLKGPASNRNNGADHAKGKWLVFTDDDCLPDPHWLEAYAIAILANPRCSVFEGRTYVDRPKRSLAEVSPINESGGYLWSCNFAIERRLFELIDGFDNRFPYAAMEDVDLGLRLRKQGYQFLFVISAAVCHPWRDAGNWKNLRHYQESILIYLSLHPEELNKINWIYYLRICLSSFVRVTCPRLLKFRFAGIGYAFLAHYFLLQMAIILFKYQLKLKS